MAEGWNHLRQTGHSQNNSPRNTGSGPVQRSGYVAQPEESAGMLSLATDTGPSLGESFVQSSMFNNQPSDVSYPPRVRQSDEGSVPLRANELNIHCQSVSGFSSYGMNRPSDGHIRVRPISMPEITRSTGMADLSLTKPPTPAKTRSPIQLEDLIALEPNRETRDRYRKIVQQLRQLNISDDDMRTVAVQNGIKCFASRSIFFKFYDDDNDSSSDLSVVSEASTINEYVTVPMSSSPNRSSVTSNMTRDHSEDPQYPMYRDRNVRLSTYRRWPGQHQTEEDLCDAGLFFTGKEDICRCFYCGLTIFKWESRDNPLVEHYRGRRDCPLASSLFSQQHLQLQEMHEQETKVLNISGNRICQACNINKIGVTQYRCGHIVCASCAPAKRASGEKRYCKICGQEVESTTAYDSSAL